MEDYIFHEGLIPSGYKPEFEEAIFNQSVHRTLQSPDGWFSFYVLNKKKKKVCASIHFYISETTARSPLRNPFGSFEFSTTLRPIVLFLFIEFVESQLKAKKVSRIIIKTPPQSYHPEKSTLIHTFLFNNNFKVTNAEVAASIPINKNKFESLLHRSEERRLSKAKSAKLVFNRIDIGKLEEVYTFIEGCRNAKDYSLSLPLLDLQHAVKACKDSYLLFGVFHQKRIAAAAVVIKVKHDILYDFYHDHSSDFDHLSPVVLLIEGIYKFCFRNKITLLDLGTSALEETPNFNLLNFKMKLGAIPNSKFTFEKGLS